MKTHYKLILLGTFFIFLLLASAFQTSALPVVFDGRVSVDGALAKDIPIKVITSFESRTTTSKNAGVFQMIITGRNGSNTIFKVYDVPVKTVVQPEQVSHMNISLSFDDSNRLSNSETCSYDEACLSNNCNSGHCCASGYSWCGSSCQKSCSSGGFGGSSRTWSASLNLNKVSSEEDSELTIPETYGLLVSKIIFRSNVNKSNVRFDFDPLTNGAIDSDKIFYSGEEISFNRLTENNFDSVNFIFRVNNSWILDEDINNSEVWVKYYDSKMDSWKKSKVKFLSMNKEYSFFDLNFGNLFPKKVLLLGSKNYRPILNNSETIEKNNISINDVSPGLKSDKNASTIGKLGSKVSNLVTGAVTEVVDKTTSKTDGTPCNCWLWISLMIIFLVIFSWSLYETLFLFPKNYRAIIFHKRSIKNYRSGNMKKAVKYQRKNKRVRNKLKHL